MLLTPPLVTVTHLWLRSLRLRLRDIKSTHSLFRRIALGAHTHTHTHTHTSSYTMCLTRNCANTPDDCQKYGRTPSEGRYADTLTHPHTHTHTHTHAHTLISSGCEFASSQLVLSCLIGWNRDRDGDEAGRGEKEGGRQAGKMSTAECISEIEKTVSNPGNSLHYLIWVHREFPSVPHPSSLNYRTFLFVCRLLLYLQ